MAGETADVALELSVRVKDMTAQALARIGKTAADAGKQMGDAFKGADAAMRRAAMTNAAAGRSATTSGDAMRRMAESQKVVNVEAKKAAVVLPTVAVGFDKSAKSAKMFGTSLGVIGGLLKRSPLLILADLASRVAGFNGVMDLFNRTMNGAADWIREWIGLAPAHVDAVEDQVKAVSKLRAELEAIGEASRANIFDASGQSFDLSGLEGQFRTEGLARLAAFEASAPFRSGSFEDSARLRADLDALRERQKAYTAEVKATERAQAEWNKALERGAAIVQRREDLERRRQAVVDLADATRGFVGVMRDLAVAEALAAQASQRRAAADALAKAEFAGALERGAAIKREREEMEVLAASAGPLVTIMRDLAVQQAGQSLAATQFLAEETARLAEEQRLMGIAVDEATAYLDEQNRIRQQARESTFGFGFGEVLNNLKEIDRFLGAQIAGGAFEGLRSLFGDVATGAKSASEAIKEFGRNFVAMIADIFAQKAAAGLLTGLFNGTFLDGAQELAKGGVMQGQRIGSLPVKAYSGGGIADSPQVAIYGEGSAGQFGEAFVPLSGNRRIPVEMRGGGGGGPVLNATFQVNSLDPTTAANVIMSNMDLIGRGITSMLQSGQDRALRTAVRGA